MKKKSISISISEKLYNEIKEKSYYLGLNVSAYITLLIQKEKDVYNLQTYE